MSRDIATYGIVMYICFPTNGGVVQTAVRIRLRSDTTNK